MEAALIQLWGRVQGVGLRASVRAKARDLGLVGKVQNMPDGTVTAWVQGDAEQMQQFISWLEEGEYHTDIERKIIVKKTPDLLITTFMIQYS